jgi:acetoin utilization deacetylase AcuC-like enzyme
MGFCLFNNIAVLARYLLSKQYAEKVVIIDFDAHHGNGTQDIFYPDSSVLYVGLHQDGHTLWPSSGFTEELGTGKGQGYTVNLPFPPHVTDEFYLESFRKIVLPILHQFQPDYVLLSAGYDAFHKDPLTDMGLTGNTYYYLSQLLKSVADQYAQGRIIGFLEGGYNKKGLQVGVYNTLLGIGNTALNPILSEQSSTSKEEQTTQEIFIKSTTAILKKYWDF